MVIPQVLKRHQPCGGGDGDVDLIREDDLQWEVEHTGRIGRVVGRDRLAVIAQAAVNQIRHRAGGRVLAIDNKLGQQECFHILVFTVGILDGEAEAVILVAAVCCRTICNILQQLMYIRQIGILFHLPAAKGHTGDMEGLFQRHTGRHNRPPVGGRLVGVFHGQLLPPDRFEMMVHTPPVRRMVVAPGNVESSGTGRTVRAAKVPPV